MTTPNTPDTPNSGINDSLDSAIRAAMVAVAESAPAAPTADELGIGEAFPVYAPSASAKPSLRTRLARGLGALGIVAGGAGLALVAANSGDDKATPEEAFVTFAEALDDEDAIGLLEAIDPIEREALRPGIEEVLAELNRLQILNDVRLDGAPLSAFNFDVDALEVAATNLGSTNGSALAAIRILDGQLSSRTQPQTLPVGPAGELFSSFGLEEDMANFAGEFDSWANGIDAEMAANDLEVIMVERDGEWFVNLGYTVLDIVAHYNDWPQPDYGNELTPNGQASPEAAARAWLSVPPFDLPAKVALLDPVQVPAFYDYASTFARLLASDGTPDGDDDGPRYTVTVRDSSVEVRDDRVVVTSYDLEYGVEAGDDSSSYRIAFDGRCVTTTSTTSAPDFDGDSEQVCADDPDLDADYRGYLEALAIGLTVTERDGLWYVNPLGSFADDLVTGMASFDELTEANSDRFAVSIFSGSIINDLFGFRGAGAVAYEESASFEDGVVAIDAETPPVLQCTEAVYGAIYRSGDGQPDVNLDPAVIATYEACIGGLTPEEIDDFEVVPIEEIIAEVQCSAVFQDLWGPDAETEPAPEEFEAAEVEFEACMEAAIGES